MNTQKSVYNKLFKEDKIELESQKVELTLADDIQKMYNDAGKEIGRAHV